MDLQQETHSSHEHVHHSAKFNPRQFIVENAPILALYLVIALVIFWPVTTNLATVTVNGAGDLYQNLWNLWWVNYATFTAHTSIYFTPMLYYPVGASLVTQTLSPITAYLSFPFQLVSLVFSYNIMFFLAFMLSGFFMYLLADYLVKNKYAAIVAGIIFAFAPMHMAQALSGHLNWTNIEFLPLFVLFFLKMIDSKKLLYSIGAAVSFVFLLFMGDPEQGIIATVMIFFLLLYYLIKKGLRSQILNIEFVKQLGIMIVLALILGSPFFIPISSALTNGTFGAAAGALNDVNHNMLWSMPVMSFFSPSPYNNFFSWLSNSYLSIYSVDPTERVSYLGYVALVLAIIGIYHDGKRHKYANTLLWIVIAVIFGWIALGPYIQFSNLSSSGIPGIYLIYSLIPFFNIIREPARFDLVLTLALAILAAYGTKELLASRKEKAGSGLFATEKSFAALLSILILVEYAGLPITGGYLANFFTTNPIPLAYSQIASIPGNFSILSLPAIQGSGDVKPELYVGMSMYYQTEHHHPLLSGYTSRTNETEQIPTLSLPIAVSASYLQNGQGLVYPSPIIENQTAVSLFWLLNYRTAFVSVIRQAYNASQQQALGNYLTTVFGGPVYQDNTTIIFSTLNATSKAGKQVVAYTAGTWIPGYSMCQNSFSCNATFGSLWWGTNVRAIDIYSPSPAIVTMNFSAANFQGSSPLYFYLNSPTNQLTSVNLSTSVGNYDVTLPLQTGINQLFLVAQNTTANSQGNPYLNFGMREITFATK